jgi:2-keto-4-pentenoate hydratase
MDRISEAAQAIVSDRRSRSPLSVLPLWLRPQDVAEAYHIQEAVHEGLTAVGWGPLVGYKIGCTTPVMQQYLGIETPCAGGVFAGSVHASGGALDRSAFLRVGVECEIAVRLGRDLPLSDAPFTTKDVSQAIASYMAAIEIVDDRYADWRQTDTPTLIADDFFAAACVLGEAVDRDAAPDLPDVVGRTFINGVEVARGTGADVMGHPHAALAWLANNLAGRGKTVRAGQIVLTGSLVQTVWLAPDDQVEVAISGLGRVSLSLRGGAA